MLLDIMTFQAMQYWLQVGFNQWLGKVAQLAIAAGMLSEQAEIGGVKNGAHLPRHAFPASTPGWAVGWITCSWLRKREVGRQSW